MWQTIYRRRLPKTLEASCNADVWQCSVLPEARGLILDRQYNHPSHEADESAAFSTIICGKAASQAHHSRMQIASTSVNACKSEQLHMLAAPQIGRPTARDCARYRCRCQDSHLTMRRVGAVRGFAGCPGGTCNATRSPWAAVDRCMCKSGSVLRSHT